MKQSDLYVCNAFDCQTLKEVALKIKTLADSHGEDECSCAFIRIRRIRGVGKKWIKEFCEGNNLVNHFKLFEKNLLPSKWVFGERKNLTEIRAKIHAINNQIKELKKQKKILTASCI